MGFGHEKPDAYGVAIEYVGWAYHFCEALKGNRNADKKLSIPIPIPTPTPMGKECQQIISLDG
jgi:hypothetical protein